MSPRPLAFATPLLFARAAGALDPAPGACGRGGDGGAAVIAASVLISPGSPELRMPGSQLSLIVVIP